MLAPILASVLLALALAPAAHGQTEPSSRLIAGSSFDSSRGVYIEGFLDYLRLDRSGTVVFEDQTGRLDRRLAPGRYRLTSFIRPCSGTCEILDPAQNRCSRSVRLARARTTRVHVRRSVRGCFIALSSDRRAAEGWARRLAARRLGGRFQASCRRRPFTWRCVARNFRCRASVRLTGAPGQFRASRLRSRCR